MTDLLELAARIEAASGADREIDRLVHFHVVHPWLAEKAVKWVDAAYEGPGEFLWWDADRLASGKEGYPDAFEFVTGSLDAAMSLVPEGHHWKVDSWHGYTAKMQAGSVVSAGEGTTPALALCAASLRARASDQKG